ncbi:hypothetical protein C0V72_13445 [Porphyrobacter sp. TH134]|uniref:DUF2975 domain-containing protein n=1 Tax=Porphyrobacter sp. TH134 TaxID=2067450 RepID=UPI000C7E4F4E|nr:DUF2975 domain-containing protein [Porphyrobacter sp. TH134]PLK22708.1 hypothetical protein C0V72_13445 [Porphyrobacter sp. TH134]
MLPSLLWIFRIANILNWVVAALFALLGIMLVADIGPFRDAMDNGRFTPAQADVLVTWLLSACLMILPVTGAVHVILTRLIAMIRDTMAGAAFSDTNADRLRMMAWMLLVINIVDLAFGQVSIWASAQTGEYLGWSLSLTGWFAVPLLLVLARLFRVGATMQSDLEGTV